MKRELKQKIKQDELVTGVQQASVWAGSHAQDLKVTVAIVAAVAVLAGGLVWFQRTRRERADAAFSSALDVFHAQVAGEKAEAAAGPTFPTAAEKYAKAQAAFDEVSSGYGSTVAGKRARYYGALCRIELGQYDQAEKALADLVGQDRNSLEGALARMAQADAHRKAGKLDQAIGEYQQMATDAAFPLPRDYALLQLAKAQEDAKKTGDAVASYRKLAEEFPESTYATEARRRADNLKQG